MGFSIQTVLIGARPEKRRKLRYFVFNVRNRADAYLVEGLLNFMKIAKF